MQTTTPEQQERLRSRNVEVDFGGDLLDANDVVVGDLSEFLVDGEVRHNNDAKEAHGACTIELLRELDWSSRPRVRLWQSISDGSTEEVTVWDPVEHTVLRPVADRYYLGVYVLSAPEHEVGEDPTTYKVEGLDKLTLLQHAVGDTYVVEAGTLVLDAVRQALVDAGYTGLPPLLAEANAGDALAEPMVWLLDPGTATSWVTIINDLLGSVGYRALWCDHQGRFRSEPYVPPDKRSPEWVFDLSDPRTAIAGDARSRHVDEHDGFNWFRFVSDNRSVRPTEGDGQYTVDLTAGAPRRPSVQPVTALGQSALVANGDRLVSEALRRTETIQGTCGPLPILGHADVAMWLDPVLGHLKTQARGHTIPLSGGDVRLDLEVV